MKRLHRFAIRHPGWVVAIGVAVTLAAAPGLVKLRLRTDGHALVPERAPATRVDRAVRAEFGVRDPLVVLVRPRHPDGVFNPRTLRLVADLTAALARVPGLDSAHVRSLATEPSDHLRPGTLDLRRLLEPLPATPAQLDTLRGDLAANGLYDGTLVSFDGAATAILVGTPDEVDRTALLAAVHDVVARADTAGHDVSLIGAPVAEALLGAHILEDLGVSWRLREQGARFADRPAAGLGWIARLRIAVARHVGLLPLAVALMAIVFWLCFRSVVATLLPLVEAGACLVFVFGLMGWIGVPVYLTMAVLPVILVSMGLADEIHVFSCYCRHRADRPDEPVRAVVAAAMDEMSLPVVATALTTAIGFLSFAISPLAPVRAFGFLTAVGIVFCMVWTLTVIPAMLVLFAPRGFARRTLARGPAASAPGAWVRIASPAIRRPGWTLALTVLVLAACPLGIRRLVVQDSWISGFARESDFYRSTQYFNEHFFGTHMLLLALDTGAVDVHGRLAGADLDFDAIRLPRGDSSDPSLLIGCWITVSRRAPMKIPGAPPGLELPATWESIVETAESKDGRIVITTPPVHGSASFMLAPAPGESLDVVVRSHPLVLPDVLRRVDALERFIRTRRADAVGGVLGPPDQVAAAAFLTSRRHAGSREIPRNPDEVRSLWNEVKLAQGADRLRETVDPEFRRALVTVFLENANFVATRRLMDALRAYAREHLEPERIRFEFAGDVAVSQTLIQAIVHSQVSSLLLSLLGIAAVTALLFRSLRWGLVCMVPAGVSVAATFAVMGATGIPLGVATSMFASMVLGIGVDFAIHLVERFRLARAAGSELAIVDAIDTTAPAIVVNGLAVTLGFGILVLSRVPANAQLGAITVVSLVACLAATLLTIPALLRLFGGRPRANNSNGGH